MLFNLICIFFRLFFFFCLSFCISVDCCIYLHFVSTNNRKNSKKKRTHALNIYFACFFCLVGCRIFSCFVYLKFRDLVTTFYEQHNTVLFSRFFFYSNIDVFFLLFFFDCSVFVSYFSVACFIISSLFSFFFFPLQKSMFVFHFVCRFVYVCESLRFLYVLYIFRTSSVKQNEIQFANVL